MNSGQQKGIHDDSLLTDTLILDKAFFDEEVRIAREELQSIKEDLKKPNLSAETFNHLHAKLRSLTERFFLANDMVEQSQKKVLTALDTQNNTDSQT